MPEFTAETRLLAVIGSPVRHSLSPRVHGEFLRRAGLEGRYAYLAFEVTPETLPAFAAGARAMGMAGFNVTMPLKEPIAPLLDGLDESVRDGAVNTVFEREGRLYGANTDGRGFVMSLSWEGRPLPERAMLLGAGGSARVIAAALLEAGVGVTAASRRAARFPIRDERLRYCSWDEFPALLPGHDLLINATPLGMEGAGKGDFADFGFLDALPRGAAVYDLIYAPRRTNLLEQAQARGLAVRNGLAHLVCQAALSFAYFTGETADARAVYARLF